MTVIWHEVNSYKFYRVSFQVVVYFYNIYLNERGGKFKFSTWMPWKFWLTVANMRQLSLTSTSHEHVSKPGAGLQPKTAPPTCEGLQAFGRNSLISIPFLNCQPSGQTHVWSPSVPKYLTNFKVKEY